MKRQPIITRSGSHSEYCKCEQCAGNSPRGDIRCACFIPGGIQCNLPMYHAGTHVYDPPSPFSEYLPNTPQLVWNGTGNPNNADNWERPPVSDGFTDQRDEDAADQEYCERAAGRV